MGCRGLIVFEGDGEMMSAIYRSLKVEEKDAISEAKVYLSDRKVELKIEAEDVSELRAAVNSWLRLVKMCSEIWCLIE